MPSDAGLLRYREIYDALRLSEMAGEMLATSAGQTGRSTAAGYLDNVKVRVRRLAPAPTSGRLQPLDLVQNDGLEHIFQTVGRLMPMPAKI
jgi:hypothetical protein